MNKIQTIASGAVGAGAMSITATHLPTWAIVFCAAGLIFVFTIQTLVPQDSRDRLHWWRDLLRIARTHSREAYRVERVDRPR